MAFEQRDGSGTLFPNDKGGNDKRPDFRGDLLYNGQLLEVSAWWKQGRKGEFLSLSAKPKAAGEAQRGPRAPSRDQPPSRPERASAPASTFDDDDIPF